MLTSKNAGHPKHKSRQDHKTPNPLRRTSTALITIAVLLATLTAVHHALSQQPQQQQQSQSPQQQQHPAIDIKARSQSILAHLSAILRFYRSVTAPIQTIGEANDVVYRDQAVTLATQASNLALQSAKAEAELLAAYQHHEGAASESSTPEEQQKLQNAATNIDKRLADLKAAGTILDHRIATARPRDLPALQAERKQLQDAIDLTNAMADALQKTVGISESQSSKGLSSDIDSLRRSAPELDSKTPPVAPQLASLDAARSSGISSQTIALFQLLGTEHNIQNLIQDNDSLHQQAQELRSPITKIFRTLSQRSQQLSQQITDAATTPAPSSKSKFAPAPPPQPAPTTPTDNGQSFASMTKTFKALSSASIPLSQEVILLEQSRANLDAWKSAVDREYKSLLHAILLRLIVILIALGIIFAGGEIWTKATNKYVHEVRRRRQLLLMRRSIVGFLSALVLLFGFVTQFNSLATFAGFITAGIAVGLQTILLSVAAYFFIIGRYGIKVGDRITVANVTGDVIDVGLVRFYMMELAGSGAELNPTGRVAVFSNAVLFQAGSPLYKQIPGTEYAWHELVVKFNDGANYQRTSEAILKVVQTIYDQYRPSIQRQYNEIQQWMHTSFASPEITSYLQFDSGAIQLWARFPVQIKDAAQTDDKLTLALLDLFNSDPDIKSAVASTPTIKASVKG